MWNIICTVLTYACSAAGSDTSATGMRGTLFCLISNPKAYTKLMAEIDAAVADGRIPSSLDMAIPDLVARELPYLQACIKEGIRWHPPIAGMLTKKTPPEGDTINGYFVPGGVTISYVIPFSPYIWPFST